MPTPGTAKWPKPKSEDEFEDIVLDALKIRWGDPNAARNGRRGQEQNGVDIFGKAKHLDGAIVGAQCKNTEKPTLRMVLEEVAKAAGFKPALAELLVVIAADRDAGLQEHVRVHFDDNPAPFTVEVVFWDDLVHQVSGHPEVAAKHWPGWDGWKAPLKQDGSAGFELCLHVLNPRPEAPAFSPSRLVVRFSVTNLSAEPVKLTQIKLVVVQRAPYSRIRLPDVGDPTKTTPCGPIFVPRATWMCSLMRPPSLF